MVDDGINNGIICLVVWNHWFWWLPIYWEFHHPNWLSYFSKGYTTNQKLNRRPIFNCNVLLPEGKSFTKGGLWLKIVKLFERIPMFSWFPSHVRWRRCLDWLDRTILWDQFVYPHLSCVEFCIQTHHLASACKTFVLNDINMFRYSFFAVSSICLLSLSLSNLMVEIQPVFGWLGRCACWHGFFLCTGWQRCPQRCWVAVLFMLRWQLLSPPSNLVGGLEHEFYFSIWLCLFNACRF